MVPSTHHWFGPDSGDRYRLAVVLLLALLGTPVVSFVVVATVDDPTAAVVLAGTAVLLALVAVGGSDRLRSVMPAVAAAYLAVLVWPTGGLTSDLNIAFLLVALASAVLHTSRWFIPNLAWMGTLAMAPFVYDPRGVPRTMPGPGGSRGWSWSWPSSSTCWRRACGHATNGCRHCSRSGTTPSGGCRTRRTPATCS